MRSEDWDKIDRINFIKGATTLHNSTSTQQKKFTKLFKKKSSVSLDTKRVIVNLSSITLDAPAENALKKGFNFAIAPRKIPIENIICGVESAINGLPEEVAEEIRQDVSSLIRTTKPPTSNISKLEISALKEIKNNSNIVVLPADKGNATVIMDKTSYIEKMNDLLKTDTYLKIRNPTERVKKEINSLIKNSTSIEEEVKKKLFNRDPRPPLLYGLPKIHKEGIPMRPIVSAIGSATHEAARYIAQLLQPMTGQTTSYIKNSTHFIEKIHSLHLDEGDQLVSFDVVSLFTSIPVEDTISLIGRLLPQDLVDIAECCLRSTYFLFDGSYYKQLDGSPMGSPLSPVAANIFMEELESTALSTAQHKPKCWFRYVDDVFLVWQHGTGLLDQFLQHMNSQHRNIKFTMEMESDRSLPFLDVLVTRKENGTLSHGVYRKPTHTDRYLNADSHHHPAQKRAVINSLVSRGIRICDGESWKKEKQYLYSALTRNGYKKEEISRAIYRQENVMTQEERDPPTQPTRKAFLPYIKGTTDRIAKILKRHDVGTTFRTGMTAKNIIGSVKDHLHLKTSGVYEVPCSCGKTYVGQTGRLISTRLQEHIRAVKNYDRKSAIAEHSEDTGHMVRFEDTHILASVPNYFNRIVREAIEIEKRTNTFNREDGYRISRTWKPLISHLEVTRIPSAVTPVNPAYPQVPGTIPTPAKSSPTKPTPTKRPPPKDHIPVVRYNLRPRYKDSSASQ